MFHFSGRLTQSRFLIGVSIRVLLFAASVFGFPFILMTVAQATNCRSVGGACGAVALIASMFLKPIFFFIFVFSLIGISLRRARDAGLPGWFGLIIPLLVLCDMSFGCSAAHTGHSRSPWERCRSRCHGSCWPHSS